MALDPNRTITLTVTMPQWLRDEVRDHLNRYKVDLNVSQVVRHALRDWIDADKERRGINTHLSTIAGPKQTRLDTIEAMTLDDYADFSRQDCLDLAGEYIRLRAELKLPKVGIPKALRQRQEVLIYGKPVGDPNPELASKYESMTLTELQTEYVQLDNSDQPIPRELRAALENLERQAQ